MFGLGKQANLRRSRSPFVAAIAAITAVGGASLLGAAVLLSGADSSFAEAPGATFAERFSFVAQAPDCPTDAWPYFKAECLRMPDGSRARPVRVIQIDRPALTSVVLAAR